LPDLSGFKNLKGLNPANVMSSSGNTGFRVQLSKPYRATYYAFLIYKESIRRSFSDILNNITDTQSKCLGGIGDYVHE